MKGSLRGAKSKIKSAARAVFRSEDGGACPGEVEWHRHCIVQRVIHDAGMIKEIDRNCSAQDEPIVIMAAHYVSEIDDVMGLTALPHRHKEQHLSRDVA
jgi:hypothetical protein